VPSLPGWRLRCRCISLRGHIGSRWWRRSISGGASLFRQRREILLTRLQCGSVLFGSAFKIHSKPNRPNYQSDETSADVLRGLPSLLVGQFLSFSVIGFNFRPDHRAVGVHILRLHACDWCWIAARACGQREADGHCRKDLGTHGDPSLKKAAVLPSSGNQRGGCKGPGEVSSPL